jgi:DNA-binding CsgD family transcriptional regulator
MRAIREKPPRGVGGSRLTVRESEVLSLLAQGCTYSRIGELLGVSLHTVTTHIKNLYRKLGVHRAAAAVHRGIDLRLPKDDHAAVVGNAAE